MKSALRERDFSTFSSLLLEETRKKTPETTLILSSLLALRTAVYGARAVVGSSGCIEVLHQCMKVYDADKDIVASCLNLLYYLLDHPPNRVQAAESGLVKEVLKAFDKFPDDKKIQANASGIFFVLGSNENHLNEINDEILTPIEAAIKHHHFQNLEVGQRNPYRFKLAMPERARNRILRSSAYKNGDDMSY